MLCTSSLAPFRRWFFYALPTGPGRVAVPASSPSNGGSSGCRVARMRAIASACEPLSVRWLDVPTSWEGDAFTYLDHWAAERGALGFTS